MASVRHPGNQLATVSSIVAEAEILDCMDGMGELRITDGFGENLAGSAHRERGGYYIVTSFNELVTNIAEYLQKVPMGVKTATASQFSEFSFEGETEIQHSGTI